MNKRDVFLGVQKVICDVTDVDMGKVTLETRLSDLGLVDWEIDCVDILFKLEKAFNIEISTRHKIKERKEDYANFIGANTVENIVNYVCCRLEIPLVLSA